MNTLTLAVRGRVPAPGTTGWSALFDRSTSADAAIRERTAAILARVRREGDTALRAMALEFDGVALNSLEVPRRLWGRALGTLNPALRRSLERATGNIRAAHEAFRPVPQSFKTRDGVVIARRPDPLERIGVYVPGGRATYPSSLLMGVVPAKVAGVREVIVCSPPAGDGRPVAVLLAAAAIAGADRVFAVGGAGAVAAMAWGTESIARVDRIVGPGNAYVAEAKLQAAGIVAIDAPAGPSELLVIADESAAPAVVALEIVAQAEHDPRAAVVLVSTSPKLAHAVEHAIGLLLPTAARATTIAEALAARGGILTVPSIERAIAFAEHYAAEHVLVCCRSAGAVAARVRNAGTIFIGATSSVAFGDYMTGANHVLPTGGLARGYSGLSTGDFYRWTTTQRISRAAAHSLSLDVGTLADAEGLPGHAAAARQWSKP
ncbi:MAG TPA: histidinol dehydrogenase [Gemmatimonadaceae bacterium]|jgi:histidinol dehydrogenase